MKQPASFANAQWISSPLVGGVYTSAPAPYFRKSFSISQPVKKATLTITALGIYEPYLNGERVGDHIFAPGWTDYSKRVQYQVYDVVRFLKKGENILGNILGDGWYCGSLGWENKRQTWGDRPKLLAHLEIILADGTTTSIVTDKSWKISAGPILQNDFLQGEVYDARLELGPWCESGYDDSAWAEALLSESPKIEMHPSPAPPVRHIATLMPKTIAHHPYWRDRRIIDFGQNFAGRVSISVKTKPGRTITLRFAEILNPDGTLYTENLRGARVTDYYTCKSDQTEAWEPHFTFHGFRYVEIFGVKEDETFEIKGIVLHSDTPPTGSFSCSHPLLNQLQSNITWGQKSNFLEVPTDCPQRDERLGWTGDAQVFIRTAAFNMDVRGFFHKWLRDLADTQTPEGAIMRVAPNYLAIGISDGGPAWSDAMVICPWTIYICYGDREVLEENYEPMVRYHTYLTKKLTLDHIRSHPDVDPWGGHGDWLALDGSGKTEGITPRDLIGTAFYAYDTEILAKTAEILGKKEDSSRFAALHKKIAAAFCRRFVTEDGLIVSGTQTSYVLALHFRLLPEKLRPVAAKALAQDVEKRGFHLATGFVGTPYILDVLTENGHLDTAYKLLEQETFPSWLFPVKNGATTIWERWDGWTPDKGFQDKGMNSFNHYAYGAVGSWMYQTVAGLDLDPSEPGYRHIIFKPRPGGTITSAQADLKTPHGKASIRWEKSKAGLKLSLTVPPGTRATLLPPEGFGKAQSLKPGNHKLTLPPAKSFQSEK